MALPDIEISKNGYCTLAHVQALNPHRTYSTTTKPSRTQVAMSIENYYYKINAQMDILGYDIPVPSTNATAVAQLRHLNSLGAAADTEQSAYSVGNEEQSSHADALLKRFKEEWGLFLKGESVILGATRASDYLLRKDEQKAYGEFNVVAGDEEDPQFTMEMDF